MAKEQLTEAKARQNSGDSGQKEISLKTKTLFPVSAITWPTSARLWVFVWFPSECGWWMPSWASSVPVILTRAWPWHLSPPCWHTVTCWSQSQPTGCLQLAAWLAIVPCAVAAVSSPAWSQSWSAYSTRKMSWLQFSKKLTNVSIPSYGKICDESSDLGRWWTWGGQRGNAGEVPVLWKSTCHWSSVLVLGTEPDVGKLSSKGKPLLQLWC